MKYIIVKYHEGDVHISDITVTNLNQTVLFFDTEEAANTYRERNHVDGFVVPYNQPEQKITMWLENRLDKEYQTSINRLKVRFHHYLDDQDLEFMEYYGDRIIMHFINGNQIGCLNSSVDQKDVDLIRSALEPVLKFVLQSKLQE